MTTARRTTAALRRRSAAATCASSSSVAHRTDEGHQAATAQDQAADMAVAAVAGVFDAERALDAQPAVLAAAQAQAAGVHGLVQPLHARMAAGRAAGLPGAPGGRPRRGPPGPGG